VPSASQYRCYARSVKEQYGSSDCSTAAGPRLACRYRPAFALLSGFVLGSELRFGRLDRWPKRGQAMAARSHVRGVVLSESAVVTAALEIRAPRPHVCSLASQLDSVMSWLWAPDQVASTASSRDLPDGTRQLIVRDGDKLRTRVVRVEDDKVVIEAGYQPRNTVVPSRRLCYELVLEGGPGTTIVTLSLSWLEGDAPQGPAQERRWRRNLDQCLERLEQQATQGSGADGPDAS